MEHERIIIRRGPRTGLPIIVAVHSTALGQALGGCRIREYDTWEQGLTDAQRLSAAMTAKCAVAGLHHGGGKTVVALPRGHALADRTSLLFDVGDTVEELAGTYATGPDVGTGPGDMAVIATRTRHVFRGDSSPATATGVLAALRVLGGSSYAVIGLGHVGADVAARLLAAGHRVVVSDIDPAKRDLFPTAEWASPTAALEAPVDVLVPAALGGLLTPTTVPRLRCRAIAGPANNQLDTPPTADLLHARGITWAPDHVVSAGGVVYATEILAGATSSAALERTERIGDTLRTILDRARADGVTPLSAATSLVQDRLCR